MAADDFGAWLRTLRLRKGWSLREVQEKTGISNAYLSQIERGRRPAPTPRFMRKLTEIYGVPIETMMIEAGYLGEGDVAARKVLARPARAKQGSCPDPDGKRARALWRARARRKNLRGMRLVRHRKNARRKKTEEIRRRAWVARPLGGKRVWLLSGPEETGAWYACCPWCWPKKQWDIQLVTVGESDGAVDIVTCAKCKKQFPTISPGVPAEAVAELIWTEINGMLVPLIGWRVTEKGALHMVARHADVDTLLPHGSQRIE